MVGCNLDSLVMMYVDRMKSQSGDNTLFLVGYVIILLTEPKIMTNKDAFNTNRHNYPDKTILEKNVSEDLGLSDKVHDTVED